MAGDRLHEKDRLFGPVCKIPVNGVQALHKRACLEKVADPADPLFRKLLRWRDVRINRGGIAVAAEGFHLKGGVDQCVAGRKCVVLRTRQNAAFRKGQREAFHAAAEQFARVLRRVGVETFPAHLQTPVHFDLLKEKPAVKIVLMLFVLCQKVQSAVEQVGRR